MVAGFVRRRNLGASSESAERKSVGDSLCSDQNVRSNTVVLDSEHLSGAPKSRLNFISDKENSVLIEDLLHLAKIIFWRNQNAAFAHHRFGDECCDVTRGCESNDFVDGLCALAATFFGIVGPQRTVCVWCGSKCYSGSVWPATFLPALISGEAQRAPAAPMKAAMERDEFVFAGVEAGKLQRTLNRLCASVSKKRFGQSVRGDVGHLLSKVSYWRRVIKIRRAVDELIHLGFGRGDYARMIVAGVDHGNP